MKITPVSSPAAIPPQGTPEHVRTARAVEAFNKGQSSYDKSPSGHSINPNNVSVEELSAIQAPNIATPVSNEETVEQEEKSPPAVEKPTVDPARSREFAQLARQEKAFRTKVQQKEAELKAKEAALSAKEAELTGKPTFDASKYVSLEDFRTNPLKVMAQTGLSYDELTQHLLNTTPTDPRTEALLSKQDQRIAELEAKLEKSSQSQVEQQQQAYQSAVKQITADVKSLVKTDPNFETIRATNSVSDVVELITQTYDKHGIVLSAEEAAQEVEDYLLEEAMKLTRIGKIKSRIEKSGQTAQPQVKPQAQKPAATPMKTLTNASSSTRQLSVRERAIAAFKGELK